MTSNSSTRLLRRIQKIALDPAGNLETALGLCLVLGSKTGSAQLRAWANQELQGFADGADLPIYRKVPAPLYLDGRVENGYVRHQLVTPDLLPGITLDLMSDPVQVSEPLTAIRALVEQARNRGEETVSYAPPAVGILLRLANGTLQKSGLPFQQVDRIFWSVTLAALEGVQSAVRSNLLMLATAIDGASHTADITAIPDKIDDLVSGAIIRGNKGDITIVNAGAHSRVTVGSKQGRVFLSLGAVAAVMTIIFYVTHW